jgi:hypothetical protein
VRKHGGLAAVGDLWRAQAARQALVARSRAERERQARAYLAAPGVLSEAELTELSADLETPGAFKAVARPYVNALSGTATTAWPTPLTDVVARARRWLGFPAALDAYMAGKPQFEGKSAAAAMAEHPAFFASRRRVRRFQNARQW